jgi:hypothetical protein
VAGLRGAPGLDVGIHLTLVGEAPTLSPERLPTLAPGGRLPSHFTALFLRLALRRVRESEVEEELVAQVARARDAGLVPSHLDSHQHVHLHPALLPVVTRVARRFGIGAVRASPRMESRRPALRALTLASRGAGLLRGRRCARRTARGHRRDGTPRRSGSWPWWPRCPGHERARLPSGIRRRGHRVRVRVELGWDAGRGPDRPRRA